MFGRMPGEEVLEMRISLTLSEAVKLDGVEVCIQQTCLFEDPP